MKIYLRIGFVMEEILTFSSLINQKRIKQGITLRQMAKVIGISHIYLRDLENNKKTNPSSEILQKLIKALNFDESEIIILYDLHAKANGIVSLDIQDYIMEKNIVRTTLRIAKKQDPPDEDWRDFIDKINK